MEAPVLVLFKTLIDILHPYTKTPYNRQIAPLCFNNRMEIYVYNLILSMFDIENLGNYET